jgi:hypothetical protein
MRSPGSSKYSPLWGSLAETCLHKKYLKPPNLQRGITEIRPFSQSIAGINRNIPRAAIGEGSDQALPDQPQLPRFNFRDLPPGGFIFRATAHDAIATLQTMRKRAIKG